MPERTTLPPNVIWFTQHKSQPTPHGAVSCTLQQAVLKVKSFSVWNPMLKGLPCLVRRRLFCFINCHLSWGSGLKPIGSPCGAAWVSRGYHLYKFKHELLSGLTQTNSSVVQLIKMSQINWVGTSGWIQTERLSVKIPNLQKGEMKVCHYISTTCWSLIISGYWLRLSVILAFPYVTCTPLNYPSHVRQAASSTPHPQVHFFFFVHTFRETFVFIINQRISWSACCSIKHTLQLLLLFFLQHHKVLLTAQYAPQRPTSYFLKMFLLEEWCV